MDVRYVAELARLELEPEETARYQEQLNRIMAYLELLDRADVEGIEPTAHAAPVFDVMRADDPAPGLSREAALANAPEVAADQFKVPKVVD